MPLRKLANNVETVVAAPYQPGDGTLTVADGSLFPSLGEGEWFSLSTFDAIRNPISILKVTALSVLTGPQYLLTIDSAMEGTLDQPLLAGCIVALVPTAGTIMDLYGGSDYSNNTPMPNALGGLPAGKTFDHESISTVLDELFYPYQSPGFSSFTILGQASPLEVGVSISGSHTFSWATTHSANVGDVQILTIATSLPSNGTYVTTINVTQNSAATMTWTAQGLDTQGHVFARNYSVSWQWNQYYGPSSSQSLDAAAILSMASSSLAAGFTGTYSFGVGGYKFFCWPDAFGGPSSFKDLSTGFGVAMCVADTYFDHTQNGFSYALVSVTNLQGATTLYRVYRTAQILNSSVTIGVS